MKKICAILLAAGTSSRMHMPKQLLKWQDKTLLEYQIEKLLNQPLAKIIVVIGHERETIKKTLAINDQRVLLAECLDYQDGLSASLKKGLECAEGKYAGTMIMLGDLPFIQTTTIKKVFDAGVNLLNSREEPFALQPCYQHQNGHPVFLGNVHKLDWNSLHGDQGAKPLLQQLSHHSVATDDFGVVFDIDTPGDYEKALAILQTKY